MTHCLKSQRQISGFVYPDPSYPVANLEQTNFLVASITSSPEQDSINSAVQHLGPLLAKSLMYNIGGNASRSELEKLSEPLRKLVVSQVHSKAWLDAALRDDAFDGEKVAMKDRMIFLQKVLRYVSSYRALTMMY